MSLQNQTYANSASAYYLRNLTPIIPTDPTALAAPVEIINISSSGAYFGRILQNDTSGLAILEVSTTQGPLMGISLNPKGTNGPVENAGPQIYAGFGSSNPNLLMTSSLTEVFGTLKIGSKTNPQDVNALTINYGNLPYPNTLLSQSANGPGTNQLQISLATPIIGTPSVTIANPITSNINTTITPNSLTIKDTNIGTAPLVSLSFVGGQGAVTATTVNKSITMIANSSGQGNINTDGPLFITTNVSGGTGPKNVLIGNIDGTTQIPFKMYGPEVSTVTNTSFIETTSTFTTNNAATGFLSINDSGISDYSRNASFNSGKITWNTIKSSEGAPITASNSLEFNNTASTSTIGGIQFYCGFNQDIPNPRWMGGFQYSDPVREFRLASTVTASLPQITNVSTINQVPLINYGNPIGTIISFSMPTPPSGYLVCNGARYQQSAYPLLYSVIQDYYTAQNGPPGTFSVPDCQGKVLMGALASYGWGTAPNYPTVATNYVATGTFQGVVTGITNPLSFVTSGIWISTTDKPIAQGMICTSPFVTPGNLIVSFVVAGDGTRTGSNRGFLIIFAGDVTSTLAQGTSITFAPNPTQSFPNQEYPQMFAGVPYASLLDGNRAIGQLNMYQETSQVGSHNHGTVATSSSNNASAASGRSEPNFSTPGNAGIFAFTVPAYGGQGPVALSAPRVMSSMPYNLGVTMCIRAF